MYVVEPVPAPRLPAFGDFTFPYFRARLDDRAVQPRLVGMGLSFAEKPLGLALAEVREKDPRAADVLSIALAVPQRRQGLGTRLLGALEDGVRARGCLGVAVTYMTEQDSTRAVEGLLRRRAFPPPVRRMLICESDFQTIVRAPFMARRTPLPGFESFPWVSLTADERTALKEEGSRERPWFPEMLTPFWQEHALEPVSSLGLRHEGRIVGWCITHRVSSDTIRFSRLFVRPDLQGRGHAVRLLAESIYRHEGTETQKAIFDVAAHNAGMLAFVERRMAPYMLSMRWILRSVKMLGDAPAEPAEPGAVAG